MKYQFDDIEIDTDTFELRRDGVTQPVEPLVFDLIYFLIQNPERIISRDEIIEVVWAGKIVSDATISSCIKSARKALGDSGRQQKYIKTIRSRGIKFTATIKTMVNKKQRKPTVPDTLDKTEKTNIEIKPSFKNINVRIVVISVLILIACILFLNQISDDRNSQEFVPSTDAPYTLAVLPFVDLSAEGNQQYFGNVISEKILNALTAVNELNVTSKTASFSLIGQNLTTPEIASQLDVNYIVEGSVRSSANRIRINVQLIDARNDIQLWSESYDRELNDIFAIQDEISIAIADAIKIEFFGNNGNRNGQQ